MKNYVYIYKLNIMDYKNHQTKYTSYGYLYNY